MKNRIGKEFTQNSQTTSFWNLADARARQCLDLLFQQDLAMPVPIFYIGSNAMATYKQPTPTTLSLQEFSLYGSTRLGISNANLAVYPRVYDAGNEIVQQPPINLPIGLKQYELTNHLGNVLSTISDFKVPVDIGNNGSTDYFTATVISQQSYYPFGMLMPERKFSVTNDGYRFGFNGKENDNEVKGIGNQQDYGMRMYETRLGRFFAVDTIAKSYPWYTPYQFAGNKPIWAIDRDGLEEWFMTVNYNLSSGTYTVLAKYNAGHAGEGVQYTFQRANGSVINSPMIYRTFLSERDRKTATVNQLPYYNRPNGVRNGVTPQYGPLGQNGVNVAQGRYSSDNNVYSGVVDNRTVPNLTEYYGSDQASNNSQQFDVNAVTQFLIENPTLNVQITGFTDRENSDTYNQTLSQQRADNSKTSILDASGLTGDARTALGHKITTVGVGETAARAAGDTDEKENQNLRRTDITITTP